MTDEIFYEGELNWKRIATYKKLSDNYGVQEGTVRDIFSQGITFACTHTQAHTAALQERVKELEAKLTRLDKECEYLSAENTDLSYQIEGVRYDNKVLRERVTELENELKLSEDTIKHQAERCLKLESENARYREALGQVIDFIEDDKKFSALSTAKEALK